MKKIFFLVALAAVGLAACATEDTIVTPQGQAIAFGDAFVDNSTKAIIASAGDIQGFKVFGNVIATADVATGTPVPLYTDTGADVTRGDALLGAAWSCGVTRYWTPSCTFNFAAVANGSVAAVVEGLPTVISYEAGTDNDLIYAIADATTEADCTPSIATGIVPFSFKHLLSKVGFTISTDLGNGYTAVITSIAVENVIKNGTYTINTTNNTITNGTWAAVGTNTVETALEFKDSASHLIIPVEQDLTVTITYNIQFNGTTLSSGLTKTGDVSHAFAANTVYNITGTLDALKPIKFTVTEQNGLGAWTEGGNVSVQ